MRQIVLMVIGVAAVLAGAVCTLQGLGYMGGSAMSGATVWAVIGPLIVVVGLALIMVARADRRRAQLTAAVMQAPGSLAGNRRQAARNRLAAVAPIRGLSSGATAPTGSGLHVKGAKTPVTAGKLPGQGMARGGHWRATWMGDTWLRKEPTTRGCRGSSGRGGMSRATATC